MYKLFLIKKNKQSKYFFNLLADVIVKTMKINTTDLIPQKPPFVMVDYLVNFSEDEYKTEFTIQSDNILLFDNEFSAGGLIENIAQSAAAGSGYHFTSQNQAVPLGYIGAVKNTIIHSLPQIGDTIQTEIKSKNKIGNASIVEGKIFLRNQLISSCELTIFTS